MEITHNHPGYFRVTALLMGGFPRAHMKSRAEQSG
jgi:hypothetical protein